MWCWGEKKNDAQRRYMRAGLGVMLSYFGLFASSMGLVQRFHPRGWHLYVAASLPCIPIVMLVFVVGRYLREEKDEFQRDTVVRSLLWGVAAMLVVEMFTGFLHTFGWSGTLPPFTEFFVLCISMIVAKFTYRFQNRVSADE